MLTIVAALVGAILLWGVFIEPRWIDVTRYRVPVPALPAAWEGKKIAFFADLQIGMILGNDDTVRRIIDRVLAERPAAVLIGGDFIYHPTEDDEKAEAIAELEKEDLAKMRALIARVTEMLRPLAAVLPVYAVLGNHDYAMETRESLQLPGVAAVLAAELEKIGISVLHNEALALPAPGSPGNPLPLYLVGIGAHYPHQDNIGAAFAALPATAPRIVMMHNPQSFAAIPAGQAPLALAGHTHGGQIRIPFLPGWSWMSIVREGDVHTDGWIDGFGAAGNRLYVNRGIGFSEFPIRINCRPELTFFTLAGDKQSKKAEEGLPVPPS